MELTNSIAPFLPRILLPTLPATDQNPSPRALPTRHHLDANHSPRNRLQHAQIQQHLLLRHGHIPDPSLHSHNPQRNPKKQPLQARLRNRRHGRNRGHKSTTYDCAGRDKLPVQKGDIAVSEIRNVDPRTELG